MSGSTPAETQERKRRFLKHLATSRDLRQAASKTGISEATYYKWLQSDRQFASQALKVRPPRLNPKKRKQRFLACLRKLGAPMAAAAKAGVHPSATYYWRQKDPAFALAMREAKASAPKPEFVSPTRRKAQRKAQRNFLKHLSKVGRPYVAAKRAGIHPVTYFAWCKADPEFARRAAEIRSRVRPIPKKFNGRRSSGRPRGTGSITERANGYRIDYRKNGKRVSEYLQGVSKQKAAERLRDMLIQYPPEVGPAHFGHVPTVETLLNPRPLTPPERSTLPRKRGHAEGSIRYLGNSCSIYWYDAQRKRHNENLGAVSREEAERILAQRTAPLREAREKENEALRQARAAIRQQVATKTAVSSGSRPKAETATAGMSRRGRPPLDSEMKRKDQEAAATLTLEEWSKNRDAICYPLGTFERFGSWHKAYEDRNNREGLSIRKSQAAKAFKNRNHPLK